MESVPNQSNSDDGIPSPEEARAALGTLDADSRARASRVVTPWWCYPALGLIFAAVIVIIALPVWQSMTIAAVIGVAGPLLLILAYRNRYGLVVSAPPGPRAKRILGVYIALILAGLSAATLIKLVPLDTWLSVFPAATVLLSFVVLGYRYDRTVREEVSAEQTTP